MMERARRLADLDGSPRVVVEAPSKFFAATQDEYPHAPVWSGELYLEGHRGTLTSQVEIKQGNRRCENLMREAELWSTTALVAGRSSYPYEELEEIWRDILLNQFHDILPGSSIAMVNDEAIAGYANSARRLEDLIERAISALCGNGNVSVAFNAAPHEHRGIPALSAGTVSPTSGAARVVAGRVLENDFTKVELDADGRVVSLFDLVVGREVIPPGSVGNVLQLHPDLPNNWPAWDVDAFYRNARHDLSSPESITVLSSGPAEAVVRVEYRFGSSRPCRPCGWRPTAERWWWTLKLTGVSMTACSRSPSPSTSTPTGRHRRSSSGTSNGPLTTTPPGTLPVLNSLPTALCTWENLATASRW